MSLFRHLVKPLTSFLRRFSDYPSDFELQFVAPKCIRVESFPQALYGGRHTVTMLPGTGIGPELCNCVKQVFKEVGAPVDFEVVDVDPNRIEDDEEENVLISIKRNGVAMMGNIERKTLRHDATSKARSVSLRNDLDLYVYVLWCKSYPGVPAKQRNVDIVLIRQNTEGEYSMLEHSIKGKVVESLKIVQRDSIVRLAKYAFEYAKRYGRKKVTTIHKANIMKYSDGLFLETAKKVAAGYPGIQHNNMIVDNCCMQIVTKPGQFDVLLTTNLYGSILANVICGLSGGPGLMSGRNYGDHYAIFEPGTRNSGTAIVGQNMANPVAMLNASVDMLRHLGHLKHAERIKKAIYKTISEDKVHTPDLGGKATTTQVVEKIIQNL